MEFTYDSIIAIFVLDIVPFKKPDLKPDVSAAIYHVILTGSICVIGFTIYIFFQNDSGYSLGLLCLMLTEMIPDSSRTKQGDFGAFKRRKAYLKNALMFDRLLRRRYYLFFYEYFDRNHLFDMSQKSFHRSILLEKIKKTSFTIICCF